MFPTSAFASTATAVDGSFTLTDVPPGRQPLVLQIGKWRRQIMIDVANACGDNPQKDGSLTLPGRVPAGDTDDSMPDIAVSTGAWDSLECLLRRVGVDPAEFVAGHAPGRVGTSTCSRGGNPLNTGHAGPDGGAPYVAPGGAHEGYAMAGSPPSWTSLWASAAQMMPFDVVLLSCEGSETYAANPPALEGYLNAGGRAFASHFHYAWFSGAYPEESQQSYPAPADWGSNLATWLQNLRTDGGPPPGAPMGGLIDATLNGIGLPFAKGKVMAAWLGVVGALGQGGVPAEELSLYYPADDVTVGAANQRSQPWILADPSSGQSGSTLYFSFDTPVTEPFPPDGGSPSYCGRAVFSDLHIDGDPSVHDLVNAMEGEGPGQPPPAGCGDGPLSPQEKALEFMLFDLTSCVTDDREAVPDAGSVVIPAPK